MPMTWQDLEKIGLDKIKIAFVEHGKEEKINGNITVKNPEMFFHEKTKTIVLYEKIGQFNAPKDLQELKSNEYINSLKVINNRENYKQSIYCSQLSVPWQNFIKSYIEKHKLITRKEYRDETVLFTINKIIDIRIKDLVKERTVKSLSELILSKINRKDPVSLLAENIESQQQVESFTGTFCEMVYAVGDMLRTGDGKKIDIIKGPLIGDILGFLNYGKKGGVVFWNAKTILQELNAIKDDWEKQQSK